ncbi:uncharacterized protein LOC126267323 isoform X1 [Schistocerca gregaria]|uniref:uncharacterized protein LOC126267313 isoform X1 n=1 Tax=Schistocerca gregaria TaxID=7010 RepID=UPI00211EF297|nr:uncharacterized protein LOC126267313 isoform X1 [Schistocerca gregaria]XP_049828381.1 uncharacterized protein LOC126267323 isoform X1 [Schistocerca gregaria]
MARAASLLVLAAALWLCVCSQQTNAFWLPSWASWYKKPDVATAYSAGTYPAPAEAPSQFTGHSLYGGGPAQALPVAVPYPVPVGPHLQVGQPHPDPAAAAAASAYTLQPPRCFLRGEMPPNAGQLSLSSYSVGVSSGGNGVGVASDAGGAGVGGVGVSVGGLQLVPCWCSVARVESEESSGGAGSVPGAGSAGGSFMVQAAQPVGN